MTDRERNTFQYKDVDIIVEADAESISGISFMIRDTSLPGSAYFTFAYFDDVKRFIACDCDWDKMLKA
jgi:hypothetical protein